MDPGPFPATPRTAPTFPTALAPTALLAHQGGWDEILLVAAPLGVVGFLLYLANRRVDAKLAEANDES